MKQVFKTESHGTVEVDVDDGYAVFLDDEFRHGAMIQSHFTAADDQEFFMVRQPGGSFALYRVTTEEVKVSEA